MFPTKDEMQELHDKVATVLPKGAMFLCVYVAPGDRCGKIVGNAPRHVIHEFIEGVLATLEGPDNEVVTATTGQEGNC